MWHGGDLDLLLVDLPPGTERFATLCELVPDLHGVVMVTIPAAVSHLVVRKALTLAQEVLRVPLIGLVENMTAYVCPECNTPGPLFPPLPEAELGVPVLGRVPFDPRLAAAADRGEPFLLAHGDTPTARALVAIGERVQAFLETHRRGA